MCIPVYVLRLLGEQLKWKLLAKCSWYDLRRMILHVENEVNLSQLQKCKVVAHSVAHPFRMGASISISIRWRCEAEQANVTKVDLQGYNW